jgi:hypothetical protein
MPPAFQPLVSLATIQGPQGPTGPQGPQGAGWVAPSPWVKGTCPYTSAAYAGTSLDGLGIISLNPGGSTGDSVQLNATSVLEYQIDTRQGQDSNTGRWGGTPNSCSLLKCKFRINYTSTLNHKLVLDFSSSGAIFDPLFFAQNGIGYNDNVVGRAYDVIPNELLIFATYGSCTVYCNLLSPYTSAMITGSFEVPLSNTYLS